jgi:hypothetical protein
MQGCWWQHITDLMEQSIFAFLAFSAEPRKTLLIHSYLEPASWNSTEECEILSYFYKYPLEVGIAYREKCRFKGL